MMRSATSAFISLFIASGVVAQTQTMTVPNRSQGADYDNRQMMVPGRNRGFNFNTQRMTVPGRTQGLNFNNRSVLVPGTRQPNPTGRNPYPRDVIQQRFQNSVRGARSRVSQPARQQPNRIPLAAASTGQGSNEAIPRRKRKPSPIASRIFRGDWWDYYNRAIQRIVDGDMAGAEEDLKEAVKLHPEESRQARTYGVRFQEYYPHAELGAILFQKGQYAQAIPELETSLASAPLLESEFFLHEAKRQVALTRNQDRAEPVFEIYEPPAQLVTNQSSIRVRGMAKDDMYVDKIVVGDRELPVGRASSKVPFDTKVDLPDEINRIRVEVTDLVGRTHTEEVVVYVDKQGPVLALDNLALTPTGTEAHIAGTVYDRYTVTGISANGAVIPTQHNATTQSFNVNVPVPGSSKIIVLSMVDGFQNQTVVRLDPTVRVGSAGRIHQPIQVAALGINPSWFVGATGQGPVIDLLGMASPQRVFLDKLYLDGRVKDATGISEILVDGVPLDVPPGAKDLYFSSVADNLVEGLSSIEVVAKNQAGETNSTTLQIDCKLPTELEPEQKLAIAIPPFEKFGQASNQQVIVELQQACRFELFNRGRFNIVESERLGEVLQEREIGESGLSDTRFSGPLASLVRADLVLDGQIQPRDKSLTLVVSAVSVKTGKVETMLEVHGVGTSPDTIAGMAKGLALKLEHQYPSVEGEIFMGAPRYRSTLTKEERVRTGTEVIVFRRGEEIILPSGKSAGFDFFPLGPMSVSRVHGEYSELRAAPDMDVQPEINDRVVVR